MIFPLRLFWLFQRQDDISERLPGLGTLIESFKVAEACIDVCLKALTSFVNNTWTEDLGIDVGIVNVAGISDIRGGRWRWCHWLKRRLNMGIPLEVKQSGERGQVELGSCGWEIERLVSVCRSHCLLKKPLTSKNMSKALGASIEQGVYRHVPEDWGKRSAKGSSSSWSCQTKPKLRPNSLARRCVASPWPPISTAHW